MQDIIQFFLDVLQVTGGDLAPAKCAWYLICHRWKNGKGRLLKVKETHRGITITSRATGRTSGVKRKAVEEGHRTLGFHMSGDGKRKAHKKVMIDKVLLYSNVLRNSNIWRGESVVAYNSLYMPSLRYGVPATTLTKEECEDIQRPVVNDILPKMGIARSGPRKVVFRTKQYGGLGLTHLAALKGNSRLQYLLGHLRCGDTTCELMQMLLEYTQLECGCIGNPLQQDYKKYECLLLNKNWITEVWGHLSTCKATLEKNGLWEPKDNRKSDLAIMERLVASRRLSGKELQQINYCRIYLQVFLMSDISDVKETEVEEWARKGKRQSGRKSDWEWPVQQRPVSWRAWKDAIEYLAPDNQISPTLGEWNK
jgi:hypothetical protein